MERPRISAERITKLPRKDWGVEIEKCAPEYQNLIREHIQDWVGKEKSKARVEQARLDSIEAAGKARAEVREIAKRNR